MFARFHLTLKTSILLVVPLFMASCSHEEDTIHRELGFEAFVPRYNTYIKRWLGKEHAKINGSIQTLQQQLSECDANSRPTVENSIQRAQRKLSRIEFRQTLGDYFRFKKLSDLPQNLAWEDGMNEPEIGDPRATKGGLFSYYMTEFPPTVRPFAKESNNSFRGRLYDEIELDLTELHPNTGKTIPGVACRWAVSDDGRTVYYEIDPDARYNNDRKISPKDYLVGIYIRVSDNVSSPYEKQYFREQFAQITTYGDRYLAVTLPEPKPMMTYATRLPSADPEFYKDYGPDYVDYYQWKVAPHSGAYYVKDKDIAKGVSIQLTRNKNWWAKDKKYYRYRFNPDQLLYTTIRDKSKAFELFRAGQLDAYLLTKPHLWYEKSEIEPVFDGYIERYMFYTQFPRSPRGLYLNTFRPILRDINTRRGIGYALNWQKVIDVIFRGDYDRLQQFSAGFSDLTNPDVKARNFSVIQARAAFKKAGYTQENAQGILKKPTGELLAVNVTYPNSDNYARVVAILKEEARKAGLELRADGLEPTVAYKKVMKKEHDLCIWGWGMQPPFPAYHQFFHSSNAVELSGDVKLQTNNINSYADKEVDQYCDATRNARTIDEIKVNSWKIQQKIHDDAIFSPGWVKNFIRIGSWRWVRWPDTPDTPFNAPIISDPLETYVLWIQEDRRKETRQAMRAHRTFPEVQKVIDNFKDGISSDMVNKE